MTLRRDPGHSDAAILPFRAPHAVCRSDPRVAAFILALVAVSPLHPQTSHVAFAKRSLPRRAALA